MSLASFLQCSAGGNVERDPRSHLSLFSLALLSLHTFFSSSSGSSGSKALPAGSDALPLVVPQVIVPSGAAAP